MIRLRMMWRLWAKALGEKAHKKDHVADKVALVRTLIFTTYLVTNAFIVAGVARHWNDQQTINIEIYETPNLSEVLHTEGRYNMGMGGNSRTEGVYHSATVTNRTGEFE